MFFAIYLWKCRGKKPGRKNYYSTIGTKLSCIIWYRRQFAGIELEHTLQLKVMHHGIKRPSDPIMKKQEVTPAFPGFSAGHLTLTSHANLYFRVSRQQENQIGVLSTHKECFFADSEGKQIDVKRATAVTIGLSGANNDQYGRGVRCTSQVIILCALAER
ncbi:hypothetical protein PHMEG_00016589 [Phytophthora megakarya]|uniref:Uncharacterized protein n=1 Tax=Phytophthora megakarya TaxID=4795 RepID=A0A225W112_9STRA|nr:hypothetical protein PHMEG_00016589 [Phytophthora megakarya]